MRCAVFSFYPMEYVIRKQRTDIREQISENRKQKSEHREQITETRGQKSENGNQILEDRYQKADIREQKTEDRKQKTGNRNQKSEIRNQISKLWAGICLKVSDLSLPAVFLFPWAEVFWNMLGNDPLCVFCPYIER